MITLENLTSAAITLLKNLIETPSFSGEEDATAALIIEWFTIHDIPYQRMNHNIWATTKSFSEPASPAGRSKPTLLLNSHHDTVQPNKGYTKDPFKASVEEGKLYGLGSNDAGGALVSLLATFTYYYHQEGLKYNLIFVASAEEENSGPHGLHSILDTIPKIDVAIVGEPTEMQLAIAEKGLVVFDAIVKGTASHAAHPNQDNAIYNSIPVLDWFQKYTFKKTSDVLGDVKMTVTQINAGVQHNAVPSEVKLVIDVRVNDAYTNQEICDILKNESPCTSITPRGIRLNSSAISPEHPLVQAGIALERKTYGSPTLSDQAVLSCPSLKLGPGKSTRSHTADEFIYISEIEEGIRLYIEILKQVIL